jgi:Flp pilus assembly protein TadG
MWTNLYRERLTAFAVVAFGKLRAFRRDDRGVSAIILGLTLPAMVGAFGLAAEVSYWRLHQRAMQNAADTAASAAATNNSTGYAAEAKSVTAGYGFLDGSGNITVSVTNPATATNCTTACYVVTITDQVPVLLSQVVGYRGDTTVNNKPMTTLTATAVASTTTAYSYCILALGTTGNAIRGNGVASANLNGCNTMSDSGADCNGHNLGAAVGDAAKTDSGCGAIQNSNVAAISDPFSGLASHIPANNCGGSYPQEPAKKNDPALPLSNQLSGTLTVGSTTILCGDQQLTGNTTINNTVLVIENGQLDTNGFTLQGTGLTVVFSGTNSGSYQHVPTGGGTLDITAPTSGNWSGVAIYQDPALTNNVDISAAGNSPTWDISGLVYLPHSNVTLSGAVNKSSQGQSCFEMVVDTLLINGTGDIFANDTQCAAAGLNQTRGGSRGVLVN